MQLLEGTSMSDIDIYAGLGGGKKRVRRDDGKIFDSIAAASMSAYGYAGSGIKRAIGTVMASLVLGRRNFRRFSAVVL